jgi:hypothetical protein
VIKEREYAQGIKTARILGKNSFKNLRGVNE